MALFLSQVQEQKGWGEGGPFHNYSCLTKCQLPVPSTLVSAGSEVFISRQDAYTKDRPCSPGCLPHTRGIRQIRVALLGGVTDHDFQGQQGFAAAQWGSEGYDGTQDTLLILPRLCGKGNRGHSTKMHAGPCGAPAG